MGLRCRGTQQRTTVSHGSIRRHTRTAPARALSSPPAAQRTEAVTTRRLLNQTHQTCHKVKRAAPASCDTQGPAAANGRASSNDATMRSWLPSRRTSREGFQMCSFSVLRRGDDCERSFCMRLRRLWLYFLSQPASPTVLRLLRLLLLFLCSCFDLTAGLLALVGSRQVLCVRHQSQKLLFHIGHRSRRRRVHGLLHTEVCRGAGQTTTKGRRAEHGRSGATQRRAKRGEQGTHQCATVLPHHAQSRCEDANDEASARSKQTKRQAPRGPASGAVVERKATAETPPASGSDS